jgi:peroxin-3
LLPTATENILEALPVEELTQELQKKRAERLARLNVTETQSLEPVRPRRVLRMMDEVSPASKQTAISMQAPPRGLAPKETDSG